MEATIPRNKRRKKKPGGRRTEKRLDAEATQSGIPNQKNYALWYVKVGQGWNSGISYLAVLALSRKQSRSRYSLLSGFRFSIGGTLSCLIATCVDWLGCYLVRLLSIS